MSRCKIRHGQGDGLIASENILQRNGVGPNGGEEGWQGMYSGLRCCLDGAELGRGAGRRGRARIRRRRYGVSEGSQRVHNR